METNVVIKIYDSTNNLDFEIPISSEGNSPLSINKDLSDLTDLTKRSGVQSRKFKIPISKEVARNYDHFNQVQHNNNKDVDGDKEAVILINDNQFESGKARITKFINKEGFESIELLFFGNNFVWTELGKNLTLADINWTVNSTTFSPTVVKNSWTNTVDNGNEFVFPLEHRGGRKLESMLHTEDFRPAMFLHSVFTRFFQNIGYTIESDFINSADFKKLVLTFFGNNFRHSEATLEANKVVLTDGGNGIDFDTGGGFMNYKSAANLNHEEQFAWNDATAPAYDPSNLFDPTAGFTNPTSGISGGRFTAAFSGVYRVKISNSLLFYANVFSGDGDFRITHFVRKLDSSGNNLDSITGIDMPNVLSGTANFESNISEQNQFFEQLGEVEIELGIGESIEIWRQNYSTSGFDFFQTIIDDYLVEIELLPEIKEYSPLNFNEILDDKVKVLDIINDVSRMFNLMFDTDPVLKSVRIEPRNDFYDSIDQAIDITNLIDTSKEMSNILNSNSHKREMVFSYSQDSADNYVKERNVREANLLAEYSHSLPNKFKEGTTSVKTRNIAPSYFVQDTGAVSAEFLSKAPLTTRYWNTFSLEAPTEILVNHKPRILNYVYEKQVTTGIGANYNEFRFYDESVNRDIIPAVLSHRIVSNQGDTIINPPINLQWHKRGGLIGLFGTYWSKTVTEIVEGSTSELTMRVNDKFWNDFKFNNVFYIDEPIEFKGYYIVEKIKNYQPENSKLCRVKLLHRVEYSDQVEGTTIFEETAVVGNQEVTVLANSGVISATFTDSQNQEIVVPMDIKI